jgi:hypothetical protein
VRVLGRVVADAPGTVAFDTSRTVWLTDSTVANAETGHRAVVVGVLTRDFGD